MDIRRSIRRLAIGGAASAVLCAWPAAADAPQNRVMATIEPGQWELRDTDGDAVRKLCVADPRQLIQLRHRGQQCSRFIVSETPREIVIHYTCSGAGHGRTTIGLVTPRSIRLDTQGIADGLPFKENYAGRRLGDCAR